MQAILTGLRSLDSVSGTNRYSQLMEKLAAGATTVLPGSSHILINLAAWNKSAMGERVEMVHGAIESKCYLCFHYSSPSGESDRKIEPYYLVFEWSSWSVWAGVRSEKISDCSNWTEWRKFQSAKPSRDEPFPITTCQMSGFSAPLYGKSNHTDKIPFSRTGGLWRGIFYRADGWHASVFLWLYRLWKHKDMGIVVRWWYWIDGTLWGTGRVEKIRSETDKKIFLNMTYRCRDLYAIVGASKTWRITKCD